LLPEKWLDDQLLNWSVKNYIFLENERLRLRSNLVVVVMAVEIVQFSYLSVLQQQKIKQLVYLLLLYFIIKIMNKVIEILHL
jgi:hypothetical protein